MIRLAEIPPVWYLEQSLNFVRNEGWEDMAKRMLKAKPLIDVANAEYDARPNYEEIRSRQLEEETGYGSIAFIPRFERTYIKVHYDMPIEEWNKIGQYNYRYNDDPRMHEFNYVGKSDLLFVTRKEAEREIIVIFDDVETGETYTFKSSRVALQR